MQLRSQTQAVAAGRPVGKTQGASGLTTDRIREGRPDLSGRVVIVTGGNSGIGLETARELARRRARVILACRCEERGETAVDSIKSTVDGAHVESLPLDLAGLSSVRRFVDAFKGRFDRLDILVNNAGAMVVPFGRTEDGFERQFGVNHLGHFALTGLLIDRLLASPGSRVVTVTSAAYRFGRLSFEDLMFDRGRSYRRFGAYAQSKLANLLFALELQRRLQGAQTTSVAAHPGGTATGLGRRATERRTYRALLPLFERLSQSTAEGARPVLRAATDPDLVGGELIAPGGRLGMRGAPAVIDAAPRGLDAIVAAQLWEISEELTGVSFP